MLMATEQRALTCKELVELTTDYLEDALSSVDKERFKDHVGLCPGCAAYLGQMSGTIRAVGHLGEDSLSPRAKEDQLRVFRNWRCRGRDLGWGHK
jgi:hypothetical protein